MMLRAALCAAVLALAAAPAARAEAPSLYAPPEADFTVAFPSPPTAEVKPAKRSKDVAFRRYIAREPLGAFVVAIDEYPPNALPQLADGGVYDHLLRNRAEDGGRQLISTRAARLSGKPCLEGTFKTDDGTVEVVRVLIVGEKLYQITFVHADGDDQPAVANAFFGSFKITAAP
jgi:hypothetical protein